MNDREKWVEVWKQLEDLMPTDQIMELMDILSFASKGDYPEANPEAFPKSFHESMDVYLTENY